MFGKAKARQQRREDEAERIAKNFEQYLSAKWNGIYERPDVNQEWQVEFRDQIILAARIAIFLAAKNTGDE